MKKIFILGGSELQVPAIKKAKEKGLYVYVLDYDSNAVGIQYADEFLCISTIDFDAVYEAALTYKPDYIISSTSDMPVRVVALVNEKLGKPYDISPEDAFCATNKVAMRKRMRDNNIPIPKFWVLQDFDDFKKLYECIDSRFVIKPADNAASRGVLLVEKNSKNELEELFLYSKSFSRDGQLLVEEYMVGAEVSVEAYTIDGVTHIVTITDKIVTPEPYFVELGHTEPSMLSHDILSEISKVTMDVVKVLGIINGPSHTELKVTSDGVKLVEIAARLGGDFITSKLVPLSTGVDMINCSFQSLLGEKVQLEKKISKGSAIRFFYSVESGILKNIEGISQAKAVDGVVEIRVYKKVGERVDVLRNSNDRIGHIIAVGKDAMEASKRCDEALKYIAVIAEK